MNSETNKYADADTLDKRTVEQIIYLLEKEIKYLKGKIEKPVDYIDWTVYNKMLGCAIQRMSMFKDDLQDILDKKDADDALLEDMRDEGE